MRSRMRYSVCSSERLCSDCSTTILNFRIPAEGLRPALLLLLGLRLGHPLDVSPEVLPRHDLLDLADRPWRDRLPPALNEKPFCPMTRSLHPPMPRAVSESDSQRLDEKNFSRCPLVENARWPRQGETKAGPHAAGQFTRSVATHSTFGAATVRATARCPLRLRVFRRRARDPRSTAPIPYRQRTASQSREPGIEPPVHYAAMPGQKHRS